MTGYIYHASEHQNVNFVKQGNSPKNQIKSPKFFIEKGCYINLSQQIKY